MSRFLSKSEILNKQLSFFQNSRSTIPQYNGSIQNWFNCCQSDYYKQSTERCRVEFNNNGKSEQYKNLKNLLPCATISGTFYERKIDCCSKNNGLIAIDIDHPDLTEIEGVNNISDLKYFILDNFNFVFSVALSVSGDGVYCIVPIDVDKDRIKLFDALYSKFEEKNIIIDKACKDVSRNRFVAYDSNILIREEDTLIFDEEKEIEVVTNVSKNVKKKAGKDDIDDDDFCYYAALMAITEYGYQSTDYNDWLGCLSTLSTLGYRGLELAVELSSQSPNYKGYDDVVKTFNSMSRKNGDSRKYFVRFFKVLKNRCGEGNWRGKVKARMKQQNLKW